MDSDGLVLFFVSAVVDNDVNQITADDAYNKNPTYKNLTDKFPNATIVIPSDSDAVYHKDAHPREIKIYKI